METPTNAAAALPDFQTIKVYSNWCYIDQLDGKDIKPGERVEVRWPDGTTSMSVLGLDMKTFTYYDHGNTRKGPDHFAYVEERVHGLPFRFYLRNADTVLLRRI